MAKPISVAFLWTKWWCIPLTIFTLLIISRWNSKFKLLLFIIVLLFLKEAAFNPDVWLWGRGDCKTEESTPGSTLPASTCQSHTHTEQPVKSLDGTDLIKTDKEEGERERLGGGKGRQEGLSFCSLSLYWESLTSKQSAILLCPHSSKNFPDLIFFPNMSNIRMFYILFILIFVSFVTIILLFPQLK